MPVTHPGTQAGRKKGRARGYLQRTELSSSVNIVPRFLSFFREKSELRVFWGSPRVGASYRILLKGLVASQAEPEVQEPEFMLMDLRLFHSSGSVYMHGDRRISFD